MKNAKKNEEIEIKLQIQDKYEIDELNKFTAGLYRPGKIFNFHMSAYYYDTDNLMLTRNKIVYRVRKENNLCVATIKGTDTGSEMLHRRFEINRVVQTIQPNLNTFADTAIFHNIIPDIKNITLSPIVTNNFLRHQSIIFYNTSKIELVIDQGFIYAGVKNTPICEMELELKYGRESDAVELAEKFINKFRLSSNVSSKFSRGLKLIKFQ
ncbi:CYTH domain-containing protein [Pectinatus frisingensis]|uniref:CYTH domain-containing protein n=1 Tax=Pectinatus frisingensis TaxID=865 RepID=UPI0018C5067D|nr:CYTH domain-containing protein [Pectinatus frisingensis]